MSAWIKHSTVITLLMVLLTGCLQSPNEMVGLNDQIEACTMINDIFDPNLGVTLTLPDAANGGAEVGIATWLVSQVSTVMLEAVFAIYDAISTNAGFQMAMKGMMTLVIMFYGISVILGITPANTYAVVMMAFKLVAVMLFATNWQIFDTYLVTPVENSVAELSAMTADTFSFGYRPGIHSLQGGAIVSDPGANNVFAMVDETLSYFFRWDYMKVIAALMTTGVMGFIYAIFMAYIIFSYFMAIIGAIKTYLIALIARALLYAVAPIFIIFALFNQTRSLFDGWIEQIINFSLQPIFMFAFLGMFHLMVNGFLESMLTVQGASQKVCPDDLIQGSGNVISFVRGYVIGDGTTGAPRLEGTMPEIPINLWSVFAVAILTHIMANMMTWSVTVASRMSGGFISVASVPIQGLDSLKASGIKMTRNLGSSMGK